MIVGERLKDIREMKNMSQGDIERKTGLLRCYLSRVENGHTVPSIETLEKLAHAMEIPLYQIFHVSGRGEAEQLQLPKRSLRKLSGRDATVMSRISVLLGRMDARDKKLLIGFAQKLAAR